MKHTNILILFLLVFSLLLIVSCKSIKTENKEENITITPIQETLTVVEKQHSDEFKRSTCNLKIEITEDAFQEDKKSILELIAELNVIMAQKDFETWKSYVTDSSIAYWSNPYNLSTISKKLPTEGHSLITLEDYFELIFVPARLGRKVTEIRYISKEYVQAVQVRKTSDAIFYSFNKVNGKWFLKLEK